MRQEDAQRVQLSSRLLLISLAQFLVGFVVAIALYPGEYRMSTNYISELGCAGRNGAIHAWIFNLSLAIFAVCVCYYFSSIVRATTEGPIELLVISGCGFLSSISVLFIAALPWNVFPHLHNIAMCFWLIWLLPAVSIWIEWRQSATPLVPGDRQASFAMGKSLRSLVFLFPIAGAFGAGPAMQKVIVLMCLSWLIVFSLHLKHAIRQGLVHRGLGGRKRKKNSIRYPEPGTYEG